MSSKAQKLTYLKPSHPVLEEVDLTLPGAGNVLLQTRFSGISRGTESLVFQGKIPKDEWERMRCPHQSGSFAFPISYGYQLVGDVLETDKNVKSVKAGDTVFLLHPHQSFCHVDESWVNKVPDGVPARRAVLSANMETALNGVWDAQLMRESAVAVIGGGVVGLLTACLAGQHTQGPVTLVDINPARAALATKLGLHFSTPDDLRPDTYDVVFHTSANGAGLQSALNALRFEGRVIEMSWYGDKPVTLNLGGVFHSKRLQIISSQVGHISPSRRATTTHKDRMAEALTLLRDEKFDLLLEPDIAFEALPQELNRIFDTKADILCQVVRYSD